MKLKFGEENQKQQHDIKSRAENKIMSFYGLLQERKQK